VFCEVQSGGVRWQLGIPLHAAFSPSAQPMKAMAQPAVGHGQFMHLPKTGWQSIRAWHKSWSVTLEQGPTAGHIMSGQGATSIGRRQTLNFCAPLHVEQ